MQRHKKTYTLATHISRDIFNLYNMVRRHHKLKKSEMLRSCVICAIIDHTEPTSDYDFSMALNLTQEPSGGFSVKVQTSVDQETYNDLCALMEHYDMPRSEMLRAIINVTIQDYFIQHLLSLEG